jgi:glycine cleavage system H protein
MVKATIGDKELDFPDGLLYSKAHQWVKIDGNIVTVGITSFAADQLGEITFVDVEGVEGAEISQDVDGSGDPLDCTVESQKGVGDIFAPISGKITKVNPTLMDEPEKVNEDPYGAAWLFKVEASNLNAEKGKLLSAADYIASIQ